MRRDVLQEWGVLGQGDRGRAWLQGLLLVMPVQNHPGRAGWDLGEAGCSTTRAGGPLGGGISCGTGGSGWGSSHQRTVTRASQGPQALQAGLLKMLEGCSRPLSTPDPAGPQNKARGEANSHLLSSAGGLGRDLRAKD